MINLGIPLNKYRSVPEYSGIYCIINILNNKKYIGSTLNFRIRLRRHYYTLRNNKHHNIHLQHAYNKYGINCFVFKILETCEPIQETLMIIEQKYLDCSTDYNISKIATCVSSDIIIASNARRIWKESSLKQKSEFMKYHSEWNDIQRKRVSKFTLDGEFIETYRSITDAAASVGGKNRRINVKRCCNGLTRSAYNYKWQFENDKQISKQ